MILNHTSFVPPDIAASIGAVGVFGRHLWSNDLPTAGHTGVLALEVESGNKQPDGPYTAGVPWTVEDYGLDARQKCQHAVSKRLWEVRNRCPVADIRLNRFPTLHPNNALHPQLGIASIQALLADAEIMLRDDARLPINGLAGYAYWRSDMRPSQLITALGLETTVLQHVCRRLKLRPSLCVMAFAEDDQTRAMPANEAEMRIDFAAKIGADIQLFGAVPAGSTREIELDRLTKSPLWAVLQRSV